MQFQNEFDNSTDEQEALQNLIEISNWTKATEEIVQLYSFKGDTILDPFCGSGTACLSAIKDERYYIGYDVNQEYVDLANRRIQEVINKPNQKNLLLQV